MSDREFENYLALLTRLLRLGAKQREQIAGELRAHLEDRLDELLARGISRDEAVRRALEEFGDAAGLAAEFVSLSRNRRRRWLMRLTTFSVAATVLMAAGIATFWPGRNAGPGAALVIAQGPKAPKAPDADPFAATTPNAPAANDGSKPIAPGVLERKLSELTNVEFVEQPLKDVIMYLQEMHGIPFVLKTKKLEEASISPDTPININIRGIRLSTALSLILDELELTYVEKEEVVLITTRDDAKATLEIRVYQCRDLLAMKSDAAPRAAGATGEGAAGAATLPGAGGFPGGGEGAAGGGFGGALPGTAGSDGGGYGGGFAPGMPGMWQGDDRASRLMSLLTTNVDHQTWSQTGGAGTISEYNGLIVVTQTAQTHKKIEHVLSMLREAAGLDASKAGKVVR